MNWKKKPASYEEVLSKLMKFCSYQERSESEVMRKGKLIGSSTEFLEKSIDYLVEEGFVNDERFTEVFTRSKLRTKRWGRYKIKQGLLQKGVDGNLIEKSLQAIDQKVYLKNLESLIQQKKDKAGPLTYEESSKIYRYLLAKGYESDLILSALKSA